MDIRIEMLDIRFGSLNGTTNEITSLKWLTVAMPLLETFERLERDWRETGERLERDRRETRERQERDWRETGERQERDWRETGE